MDWRVLVTRLGGLGLVGATTTGAVLSFREENLEGLEDKRWDFLIRKSDQEIKAREKIEWKSKPIIRKNNKGNKMIGREIWIDGEEEDYVDWRCNIRGVMVGDPKGVSMIEGQLDALVKKIGEDVESRNRFIDNCALNRLDEEKEMGNGSEIELEVVSDGEKYEIKGLERVYTESGVMGHRRLNRNERKVWEEKGNYISFVSDRVGVLKLYHMGRAFCIIHGTPDDDSIAQQNLTYKDEIFRKQFENLGGERRKYVLKNCLKNSKGGNIHNMKVVRNGKNNWKFKDMDSLSTKIYEIKGV